MADICEYGNELLDSINVMECLDQVSDSQLVKRTILYGARRITEHAYRI